MNIISTERKMVSIDKLNKTEFVQCDEKINSIKSNYSCDSESDIDWTEQPGIIVDPNYNIIDGHHRYESFKQLGFSNVPVIVVDGDFDVTEEGFDNVMREVCEDCGDYVTYGIY